jgi:flavin reductase (DIM6/NTAB) family NADH-FMN oxidoreductase RutF
MRLHPAAFYQDIHTVDCECPINFECQTYKEVESGRNILFFGEVLETHVDEEALDEKGRIITERIDR